MDMSSWILFYLIFPVIFLCLAKPWLLNATLELVFLSSYAIQDQCMYDELTSEQIFSIVAKHITRTCV